MSFAASQPNLRLVGGDDLANSQWRASEGAKQAVVKENRLAATPGMDANDPRWVLAMQTQARLQGATLTPERREQLLNAGQKLGLRPFESNLVIAVVQDQARQTGRKTAHIPAALKLVPGDARTAGRPTQTGESQGAQTHATWPQWFLAVAGALAVAAGLIKWLVS